MNKQVGWFHLKEDTIYTNTFEFAAWYEKVLIPAGRYPVEIIDYHEENCRVRGHINSAYITMTGTIVSDYFAAHFCGVPVSDYDTSKNVEEESTHTTSIYLYDLAEDILKGNSSYELYPEYEAKEINFVSWYDGKEKTTHGIFKKEN